MTEHLEIDIARQELRLADGSTLRRIYRVSTAAKGVGEAVGSGCTPCGLHRIRIKIGADCPSGTVFVGRRPTGEIYSEALAARNPRRDWILTRILWLTGSEPGRNRGGLVDTLKRFIYIHGCPDTEPMGTPRSHGCIRMRNDDLLDLFERVSAGTPVDIRESFADPFP
jgi:lipoprotein-anchoring transpeptidase ErfK/SrfK